jgi:hypothetical protein
MDNLLDFAELRADIFGGVRNQRYGTYLGIQRR